jgi:hypothetical protein
MFGLFSRLRPRLDTPEPALDEGRMSLAELEALLREIAADRPRHSALSNGGQQQSRQVSSTSDRAPKLASYRPCRPVLVALSSRRASPDRSSLVAPRETG